MRYAILSDIHANIEALDVVLADVERRECDALVCLGDFVGYGPNPNECVERLRSGLGERAVAGNHDRAAVGKLDITFFNAFAQAAIVWTQQVLRPGVRDYLNALPETWQAPGSAGGRGFLAVHGSPRDPIEEYVLDVGTAAANFRERTFGLCFIGHSHVPGIFKESAGETAVMPFPADQPMRLEQADRYLINVGSVGQPRDGDPRAAYAVLDEEEGHVVLVRLDYPLERTQARMREEGLPPVLAERLSYGR